MTRERRALSSLGTSYPADNKVVVGAELILGTALTRTGRAAEAEPVLREGLSNGKHWKPAPPDRVLGNPETALGECLLAMRRYAEAEPLLLQGYAELKTRLGEHDKLSAAAAARLHALHMQWNKPAEAFRFVGDAMAHQNPPAAGR